MSEFPTQDANDAPSAPAGQVEAAPGPRSVVANHVVESIQTVLTALMLAFMFRAFFVEAFIIPTGSMAESLMGAHGAIVCPTCGWEFDFGPRRGVRSSSGSFSPPGVAYCPNCHTETRLDRDGVVSRGGDRILVHKWPYLFGVPLAPNRWDVIVFRDPANGAQNYIKRLVGLPGESIEIVDGDVFIKAPGEDEFHIARKTPAAQSMLWFVVYDQSYAPAVDEDDVPRAAWVAEESGPSRWSGLQTRRLRCNSFGAPPDAIVFDPIGPFPHHYFQDVYGYNSNSGGHFYADARIRADVSVADGVGWLRFELARDDRTFSATLHRDGRVELESETPRGERNLLGVASVSTPLGQRSHTLELGHLDYRVYVSVDGREVLSTTDAQHSPDLPALRHKRRISAPRLRIVAADIDVTLDRLRIDRDVYYAYSRSNTQRAYAGHAFTIGADEYFMLGDNSPNSHDSREWSRVGVHLRRDVASGSHQIGTVPYDQIVGQAFFVYLPGLVPLDTGGRWRVPDLGRVRFIR